MYGVNLRIADEDVDSPLVAVRPVKKIALVVFTGDRGLCGGYNNALIKKAEIRAAELKEIGVESTLVVIGRKVRAPLNTHTHTHTC